MCGAYVNLVEKQWRTVRGDAFSKVGKVFTIKKLNKHQEDSIKYAVEKKKDVFVNFLTGFGKSLIYQTLPLVFSSVQSTCEKNIVVVISPLTSYMKNQVQKCVVEPIRLLQFANKLVIKPS